MTATDDGDSARAYEYRNGCSPFQPQSILKVFQYKMGRKKKDAEAAFFADFDNDEFSAAADDSAPEPVAPGMFSI